MLTVVASTVDGEVPLVPAPGVPDAVTQSPRETADELTVLVWEKVVVGVQSTVVWLVVDCTSMVAPATLSAATVPDTTGGVLGPDPLEPEPALGVTAAAAELAAVELDPPHAARTTALPATTTSSPPGRLQGRSSRSSPPVPQLTTVPGADPAGKLDTADLIASFFDLFVMFVSSTPSPLRWPLLLLRF